MKLQPQLQFTFTHYGDNVDELDKYVKLTVATAVGESDATVASDGTQTQIIQTCRMMIPKKVSFALH